tara:strand:+ start:5909 stop:6388 length:480 start_codon:yes stop_codon:yes gene_type:complete
MKTTTKITFIIFICVALTTATFAQTTPDEGSIGIRSSIGSQVAIEIPYQLNENLSIAPALTINTVDGGTNTIGFAVIPRYYTSTIESLSTYVTGNLGFRNQSFDTGGSATDFTFGIGYGAEYFLGSNFSLSTDANLGIRAGDSANNFFTSARVSASVYF